MKTRLYDNPFHNKPISDFRFLVTGGAGFIGSHLVEYLLRHDAKKVRVLDNFLTGKKENVDLFRSNPSYELQEGDIRHSEDCRKACEGIDYVLHQAALASVIRSMQDPLTTQMINADGFINMLVAARDQGVKRIVYASSSSVFGDHADLPKKEEKIGNPLSPYAISKLTNELYAHVYSSSFGMEIIGLRYFNVFGPRQDPFGPYAAVIPRFLRELEEGRSPIIYGDGSQTRDFTFVSNAVQANIKALFTETPRALNQVYNVAFGEPYSILQLYQLIADVLKTGVKPQFEAPRQGDILHSLADISKARMMLSYFPDVSLKDGLTVLMSAQQGLERTK